MPINKDQLRDLVIIPTLHEIGLFSNSAVNLLLGTAAQESHLGTYIHQMKGPALGIYQLEPFSHDDIYENVLKYHPVLKERVLKFLIPGISTHENLIGNLFYATAMARIQYWREPSKLPEADDIKGLAYYWDKYYNKNPDKGFPDEFIKNYNVYVL